MKLCDKGYIKRKGNKVTVTQKTCICHWTLFMYIPVCLKAFHVCGGACRCFTICYYAIPFLQIWTDLLSSGQGKLWYHLKRVWSFSPLLQAVVRERCRWRPWRLLTWRWRAGRATPASRAGGLFPAAPQMSEASSAWGVSSSRGHITSTPDLTLSAPWRNMIWIKVGVDLTVQ